MTPDFLYGTAWKEDRTADLVGLALRAGFRAIDTANQRKHYFEAAVGEALAAAYRDGLLTRGDLFLQTKFTYEAGQDHRLPFDPAAPSATQVAQSLASSLEHLGTDHVDSFLLHGPASGSAWTTVDSDVWHSMSRERDAGRTRHLGVSNVSIRHLKQMSAAGLELPSFVQNRCYARFGWDREVRLYCREHGVSYQAFSLLTANQEIFANPAVAAIARRHEATLAQLVFAFSLAAGMLPITGTTSAEHMRFDLASKRIRLSAAEVSALESIAG